MSSIEEIDNFKKSLDDITKGKDDLDISNWWTAFQADSLLVGFDDDCLQHIFSRFTFLSDAHHLGLTCRRLYFYFKKSQRLVKAIELTNNRFSTDLKKQKTIFMKNINSDADDDCIKQHNSKKLIPVNLGKVDVPLAKLHNIMDLYAFNLKYLEVSIQLKTHEFDVLLKNLKSLLLLTTLNLILHFKDCYIMSLKDFWRPLEQLVHSSLRHLTVNTYSKFTHQKQELQKFDFPLPILRQLTSFSFFIEEGFSGLYRIINYLVLNPTSPGVHLAPGVGARFGVRLFYNEISTTTLPVKLDFLSYITYLDVNLTWCGTFGNNEASLCLFRALPFMHHLQKIHLNILIKFKNSFQTVSHYPDFINAVSSLPHLTDLSIECTKDPDLNLDSSTAQIWPRFTMFVLPSVRVFSLKYFTIHHVDVVELFHLDHCFPNLKRFNGHFTHRHCSTWQYNSPAVGVSPAQAQQCGQELTRGLLTKLPDTVCKENMTFEFDLKVRFTSLSNLQNGKSDIW